MIRKYHNHKLQTTPWNREEEPLNHHKTPGRQIKQSNQLSLPQKTQSRFIAMVSSLIAWRWVRPQTLWGLWRKALIGGLVPDAYL